MIHTIVFVLTILCFARLSGFIAHRKNADVFVRPLAGGVFGPFALPFVFFAKPRDRQPQTPGVPKKTAWRVVIH